MALSRENPCKTAFPDVCAVGFAIALGRCGPFRCSTGGTSLLLKGISVKSLHKIFALGVVLAAGGLTGCIASNDSSDDSATMAALRTEGTSVTYTGKGNLKVDVCHIPPGNPANMHVITVGMPAVKAHLAHGDRLGNCTDVPPNDTLPPNDDQPPQDVPNNNID